MRQNYSNGSQNSGNRAFYNVLLLHWFRERSGLTVCGTADAIGMNRETARQVFKGKASYKQVKRVADFYNCSWSVLHDPNLPESQFDRAVLNGKAARSTGPACVGARRLSRKRGGTYTRKNGKRQ